MEKNEMEKIYIREIPEEEYSMTGKPQVIAGGKNAFREIRKEEYRKMENEKNHIREIQKEGYMLDENKNLEKKIMIYI